jgi:adenine-specific DNA-methyltransferase
MASLVKTYSPAKLFGQIYTPNFIVDKVLDDVGFVGHDIICKRILDPACGDGQYLIEIVKRIIGVSKPEDLTYNLSFVYGWDIDPIAVLECKRHLNRLVEGLGITIDWNISVCNALEKLPRLNLFNERPCLFNFIVGNPPYIRIQHLEKENRNFIQKEYSFCRKGSTDIYIAFFELALNLLNDEGICGFITPNTYFYTETANELRAKLWDGKLLRKVANYGAIQIFDNATTYSAITIFGRGCRDSFKFEEAYTAYDFFEKKIFFEQVFHGDPWQLTATKHIDKAGRKLKEMCRIQVGLTTLCDKAYFLTLKDSIDKYSVVYSKLTGLVKIESAILRPIIKASRYRSSGHIIKEYALFPYELINNEYKVIPEDRISQEYPLAYQYLLDVKSNLDSRDNGKLNSVAWYAYGRNQGINIPRSKKILFSPISKTPNFQICDREDVLFYSGYCILYDGDLNQLLTELNSNRMADFISVSSRDFRGGYKAYNKTIVQEFTVSI